MASTEKVDLSRIIIVPGQRSGQPCIRELHVTVWDVMDMLAFGMTEEEILADYPYLEKLISPPFTPMPPNQGGSASPVETLFNKRLGGFDQ